MIDMVFGGVRTPNFSDCLKNSTTLVQNCFCVFCSMIFVCGLVRVFGGTIAVRVGQFVVGEKE